MNFVYNSAMQRVYLSLALVVLIVGGYFLYTRNSAEKKDSSREEVTLPSLTTESSPLGATTEVPSSATTTPSNPKTMIAKFITNKGEIALELFPNRAPNTVGNFIKLAQAGFYDGTRFHRVIKGFMIQGGDPLSKDEAQMARWGTGGPGYTFEDELGLENHNVTGTIAMANAGPNTNGSQFFINAVDNNYLDGKHTVFGRVVSGMDAVRAIEGTPTEPSGNRPLQSVIVEKVIVSEK